MRVGKTPQAILAMHAVGARSAIVLCPAIAVPHWKREITRWWPDRSATIHLPGRRDPLYNPDADATVLVLSYDAARADRERLKKTRWDVLIADEAHYAKNPGARRTKDVYGKDGLGWSADRVWALSGTPAPRHAGELWPMLRAFGATMMDYGPFCAWYCRLADDGRVVGTREERIPELRQLLAPIMLRRTRAQVAPELRPIQFNVLPVVPMTRLLDESGMPEKIDPGYLEANAKHLAEWRIAVALAKVPALVEQITGDLGALLIRQTVVFGVHLEPLRATCDRLTAAGYKARMLTGATPPAEREEIIAGFHAGEVTVICANIIAAGTAIDLSAAHHGYFLEMDWVPGNNLQAANRLVALDKPRPVTYDVVSWHGSFDDRIQRVLARRARELEQLY